MGEARGFYARKCPGPHSTGVAWIQWRQRLLDGAAPAISIFLEMGIERSPEYYNYTNMSTSGQLTACLQPPSPTGSLCLHQCLPLAARRSSAPLSWPGKARRAGGPVIEATGKRISCLSEKIEVKAPKIIFDVSVQIQLN